MKIKDLGNKKKKGNLGLAILPEEGGEDKEETLGKLK